ncbi:hypothetical protein AB0H28_07365 [Micromonospora sp. NPDC050980]|uniref:hypothetical protein n=1 Tax=Micromonospora sp. NPDC050980 TaxID=3155161 RepID=UPI0034046564
MTNTGDDSTPRPDDPSRTRQTGVVLLAVAAVWLLAMLLSWAYWVAGDDRDPDNLLAMVVGTAVPGLLAIAAALVLTRRSRDRR